MRGCLTRYLIPGRDGIWGWPSSGVSVTRARPPTYQLKRVIERVVKRVVKRVGLLVWGSPQGRTPEQGLLSTHAGT